MEQKSLENLMTDKGFNEKLGTAKNEDEVKALFAENGIDVDVSEEKEGEFDEAELKNVVGGASGRRKFIRVKINGRYVTVQINTPFGNFSTGFGGGFGGGGSGGGRF